MTNEQLFKIDRSKWLNGNHERSSKMCNTQGEKCCLGFITQQATNCSDDDMYNFYSPGDLFATRKIKFDPFVKLDGEPEEISSLSTMAMSINDSFFLPDNLSVREDMLINLFKDYGIHIEFHGEYPNE